VDVDYRWRCDIDDEALSALHASAFGGAVHRVTWRDRLEQHSLGWVGAFVNIVWDGGAHAFVVDTAVAPSHQRQGIGTRLVREAVGKAAGAGCDWLHADFAPHLERFYLEACGFTPTLAGLHRLDDHRPSWPSN
jgi:GNAT superfamily N-acetyltransferase